MCAAGEGVEVTVGANTALCGGVKKDKPSVGATACAVREIVTLQMPRGDHAAIILYNIRRSERGSARAGDCRLRKGR